MRYDFLAIKLDERIKCLNDAHPAAWRLISSQEKTVYLCHACKRILTNSKKVLSLKTIGLNDIPLNHVDLIPYIAHTDKTNKALKQGQMIANISSEYFRLNGESISTRKDTIK